MTEKNLKSNGMDGGSCYDCDCINSSSSSSSSNSSNDDCRSHYYHYYHYYHYHYCNTTPDNIMSGDSSDDSRWDGEGDFYADDSIIRITTHNEITSYIRPIFSSLSKTGETHLEAEGSQDIEQAMGLAWYATHFGESVKTPGCLIHDIKIGYHWTVMSVDVPDGETRVERRKRKAELEDEETKEIRRNLSDVRRNGNRRNAHISPNDRSHKAFKARKSHKHTKSHKSDDMLSYMVNTPPPHTPAPTYMVDGWDVSPVPEGDQADAWYDKLEALSCYEEEGPCLGALMVPTISIRIKAASQIIMEGQGASEQVRFIPKEEHDVVKAHVRAAHDQMLMTTLLPADHEHGGRPDTLHVEGGNDWWFPDPPPCAYKAHDILVRDGTVFIQGMGDGIGDAIRVVGYLLGGVDVDGKEMDVVTGDIRIGNKEFQIGGDEVSSARIINIEVMLSDGLISPSSPHLNEERPTPQQEDK